ncbi:MAG: lipoyl(octanoyl) transferase LipB [Thermoanaerobaculia bacterium]
MTRVCVTRPLHLVTYENGMAMQETLAGLRQKEIIPDQFLLLEHPPVITLGRGGDQSNLLAGEALLRARGVRFYPTTRGGDITFHGPEQLVGYPIVHLGEGNRDVRKYVWKLEEVLIRTVADYGIVAERVEGRRGIWVGNNKIAAIGVRIARWVTSHGFALNVNTDLTYFSLITPCGLQGTGVTSIQKLTGQYVPLREVMAHATRHFGDVFEREMAVADDAMRIVKVVLHDRERVLLLHRKPDCGDLWQPVTGGIDDGEAPADAAKREVLEETGCAIEPIDAGFRNSFLIDPVFVAEAAERPIFADEITFHAEIPADATIRLDLEEHDASSWFSFGEAYEKLLWSDDRDAIEIVERMLREGVLSS